MRAPYPHPVIAREGWRQARTMPPGTFAGWSLACAFAWVIGAAATLAVQAVLLPGWAELRDAYLVVLGPLVAGFAVQLVSGAMSYLLPVVAMGSPKCLWKKNTSTAVKAFR